MTNEPLTFQATKALFDRAVMNTYGRFDIAFVRGSGSRLWDTEGRRYLDLAAGIAVCSLGHANPELTEVLTKQAGTLWHTSNLYFHSAQGELAGRIADEMQRSCRSGSNEGGGKVFFCNSGAEANEALFKLARKAGKPNGRWEILTADGSFHGRTLAGISATGQSKVKAGFEPMVEGFRSVPFNDLDAMNKAISDTTAAILIEGVQGEGGIRPATPEYLLGLRKLCDRSGILLMMDAVQCGVYRTGRFQSFEPILDGVNGGERFFPDAVSFAKGLGGGLPIGAIWARGALANVLQPGEHAATFGGNLLSSSVALRVLEIIERDNVGEHVRRAGARFMTGLRELQKRHPERIREVRGLGFMIGLELSSEAFPDAAPGRTVSAEAVARLLEEGVVTIPAGPNVVRFVPPLTTSDEELAEGLDLIDRMLAR